MQRWMTVGLIGVLLAWAGLPAAHAGKGDGPKARFFAKYDANKNGVIDGAEKDAVRKDYAADKNGDLKRFDTNQDGRLSDEELAAIKPPAGKKKSAAGKSSDDAPRPADKSGSGAEPQAGSPGAPEKTDAAPAGSPSKSP